MKSRFLSLPVLKPNMPNGGYLVGDGADGIAAYPEGTQTHVYIIPGLVKTIAPAPITEKGIQLPGCYLHIDGQQQAIFVYMSADEACDVISKACA